MDPLRPSADLKCKKLSSANNQKQKKISVYYYFIGYQENIEGYFQHYISDLKLKGGIPKYNTKVESCKFHLKGALS